MSDSKSSPKAKIAETSKYNQAMAKNEKYYIHENLLVVFGKATLPKLCILSGEMVPRATPKTKKIRWTHPATIILIFLGILPYFVYYLFFSKKISFTYFIAEKYRFHRARIITCYCLIALSGVICFMYLIYSGASLEENLLLYILSIAAFKVGGISAASNSSSFRVEKYKEGKFYISGLGNGFLAAIQQDPKVKD